MKQSGSSAIPPAVASATATAVSDKERIEVFNRHGGNNTINNDEMKKWFISMIEVRSTILSYADTLDAIGPASMNLHAELDFHFPVSLTRTAILKSKKTTLTKKFVILCEPLVLIHEHLLTQFEAEQASRPSLRHSTTSLTRADEIKPVTLDLLDQFVKVMDDIEKIVIDDCSKELYKGYKSVTLTREQKSRLWSEDRVPGKGKEALQYCVMCNHRSTNFALENDEVDKYNIEIEKEYCNNVKAWEEYKQKLAKGNSHAKKPAELTRKPRRKPVKEPILMCMRATSYCTSICGDTTNNCPVKCQRSQYNKYHNTNDDTCTVVDRESVETENDRFPFIGSPTAKCSCPICACKCNFACTEKQVTNLLFATRKFPGRSQQTDDKVGSTNIINTGNTSLPDQQLPASTSNILTAILTDATKTAFSHFKDDMKRQQERESLSTQSHPAQNNHKSSTKYNNNIQQRCQSLICETAATNLLFKSPTIGMKERQQMQKSMGKSTIVQLPSCKMDTRAIMSGDTHGTNNRLGAATSNTNQPGMLSNLDIDFQNVCEDYVKEVEVVDMSRSPLPNAKRNILVDLVDVDSNSPTVEGNCATEQASLSGDNHAEELVVDMHGRIVCCARSFMRMLIEEKLENGNMAEKKKERKYMKRKLRLIEKSEKEGNHLNNIKCVTDNGELLMGESPMSSQDVLRRVDALLSDDDEDEE